jgi:CubicO group peptidase (beta-lactamase class C family)
MANKNNAALIARRATLLRLAGAAGALACGHPPMTDAHTLPDPDAGFLALTNNPAFPLASLSVLAINAGKVVYHRQFGRRFIAPAGSGLVDKPANGRTLYRVASISKLLTAIITMALVESGKLDLDRDIGEYLGLRVRNPHFPDRTITARQLLVHTSSLRDDAGSYWDAAQRVNIWKDVLTPGGKHHGQGAMWSKHAAPGTYFQYNNFAWGVLAGVLEKAANERFDHLAERLLFKPLGIVGSFNPATLSAGARDNIATLYRKRVVEGGREVWKPDGPWVAQTDDYSTNAPEPRVLDDYEIGSNGTLCGPQGNCRLTAEGLGTIMLMLMNDGKHGERSILNRTSVEHMLSRQWTFADGPSGPNGSNAFGGHQQLMNAWGLGNQHFLDISGPSRGDRLVEPGGFRAVGHLGIAWGLTSCFAFDKATRRGLIYLVGGTGVDPELRLGKYSGLYRHEEEILTALYRL